MSVITRHHYDYFVGPCENPLYRDAGFTQYQLIRSDREIGLELLKPADKFLVIPYFHIWTADIAIAEQRHCRVIKNPCRMVIMPFEDIIKVQQAIQQDRELLPLLIDITERFWR